MVGICLTIISCVAIVCFTIIMMYGMKLNRKSDSNKNMELVGIRTDYNRYPLAKLEFDNEKFEQDLDDTLEKLKELQIYKQTVMKKQKEENQNAD